MVSLQPSEPQTVSIGGQAWQQSNYSFTGITLSRSPSVAGFRDLSLGYTQQVAKEEGATIWKDDHEGYVRENVVKVKKEWVAGPALVGEVTKTPRKRK